MGDLSAICMEDLALLYTYIYPPLRPSPRIFDKARLVPIGARYFIASQMDWRKGEDEHAPRKGHWQDLETGLLKQRLLARAIYNKNRVHMRDWSETIIRQTRSGQ